MHLAGEFGYRRIEQLLQRNGVDEAAFVEADPEARFMQAVKNGDLPVMRQLAPTLETLNFRGKVRGWAPMTAAIHARRIDAARLLLELGADPEFKSRDGTDALWATVCWSYGEVDKFRQELIDRGVNVNSKDRKGTTVVMRASSHGTLGKSLEQLAAAGADLNAVNKKSQTALDLALLSGRTGAAEFLQANGARQGTRS